MKDRLGFEAPRNLSIETQPQMMNLIVTWNLCLFLKTEHPEQGQIWSIIEIQSYFTQRGLNKRFVLHEFYHHLVYAKDLDMQSAVEEKDARNYAREFLRSRSLKSSRVKT